MMQLSVGLCDLENADNNTWREMAPILFFKFYYICSKECMENKLLLINVFLQNYLEKRLQTS